MKKINSLLLFILFFISCNYLISIQAQNICLDEADYTIPSWTLFQRAVKEAKDKFLVSNEMPYNVTLLSMEIRQIKWVQLGLPIKE